MKTKLLFSSIIFCVLLSDQIYAKDIARYFNNAQTSNINFVSSFSCSSKDHLSESEVRNWISKNQSYFYHPDSISIISEIHWLYGARHKMIKSVYFITAENGPKRKNYFDEIKRKKEEERLEALKKKQDAIKKKEETDRLEKERLANIKSQIEKGTFTGKHFYVYKEGKYVGDFVNGKREGYGTQNLPNGEWYEGYFKNDAAHGQGTYRQSSGIRYTGNFINNKRHGKFFATRWTLLGLVSDTWELEYENDVLVSKVQTSSGMTDFMNNLSDNESSSNYSEKKNEVVKEDCEKKYIKEFDLFNKSKIQYEEWKKDNLNLDYMQLVKFPDGTSGYIYQGSNTKRYFLSLGGTNDVFYKSYEDVVRALFIYKKCGEAPKIGRLN